MKSTNTKPIDVALGELAAIAARKTMPRVGPLSDSERERRRQRLKLQFDRSKYGK